MTSYDKIFIDTNILIYAAGAHHPHKEPSVQFLLKIAQGKITAFTSTEVLQEILYYYHKAKEPSQGLQIIEKVITIIPLILPVTKNDILSAKDLLQKYQHIEPRDAIHAAVIFNRGLKNICSYDKHFDTIPCLKRITPS